VGNVAVVDARRDTPPMTGSARTERLSGLTQLTRPPWLIVRTLKSADAVEPALAELVASARRQPVVPSRA
jgi:hypothetical protein